MAARRPRPGACFGSSVVAWDSAFGMAFLSKQQKRQTFTKTILSAFANVFMLISAFAYKKNKNECCLVDRWPLSCVSFFCLFCIGSKRRKGGVLVGDK